jgi:hypothetical protein
MLAKIALLLLVMSTFVYAETRTYLVKRAEHFPQDRYLLTLSPQEYKLFVATGRQDIKEAEGQPFKMTSYTINYSGKYALWTVTSKDADEDWHMESMKQKKYIDLISVSDVVETDDKRTGGKHTDFTYSTLMDMPTDYYEPLLPCTTCGAELP